MFGGVVYMWIKPSNVYTNFVYPFHELDGFVSEFVLDIEIKQHKKKKPLALHQRMFPLSAKKGTNMEKCELSFLDR